VVREIGRQVVGKLEDIDRRLSHIENCVGRGPKGRSEFVVKTK
jgi:hypothetical protein